MHQCFIQHATNSFTNHTTSNISKHLAAASIRQHDHSLQGNPSSITLSAMQIYIKFSVPVMLILHCLISIMGWISLYHRLSIYRGYICYDSAQGTTIIMIKLQSNLHSWATPNTSPSQVSCGVSFMSYCITHAQSEIENKPTREESVEKIQKIIIYVVVCSSPSPFDEDV